jgi:hypothetical protein
VKLAWRICSVLACLFTLSAALAFTVILATKSAYVTGVDAAGAQRALEEYSGGSLRYRNNPRAIASVVFLWPGMVATMASTCLLWHSLAHIDEHGPKSRHARVRDGVAEKPENAPIGTRNGSTVTADKGRLHNAPQVPTVDGSHTVRPVSPSMSDPDVTQPVGKREDGARGHSAAGSRAYPV